MSTVRFGPRDLLEYDERYGVLVCRECRYAIQKSALQSHLLRHKIYRSERHELLRQIAPLKLLEPHQVPLPAATAAPVEALPVISGYHCTSAGCGCLYASVKRMKRHQSESHGRGDAAQFSSYARRATLQTFFRGTKLRYFEVTGQDIDGIDSNVDPSCTNEPDPFVATSPRGVPRSDTPPRPSPRPSPRLSPINLDMDTLVYFHHFLAVASPVLPRPEGRGSTSEYWQTDVVDHALQDQYLMCGLLAISASHLAAEVDDAAVAHAHRSRSARFFAEFSAGWDATTGQTDVPEDIGQAARLMGGVLRCAHWGWRRTEPIRDAPNAPDVTLPLQLQSIVTTVRGFAGTDLALRLDSSPGTTLDFHCLRTLPYRMTELFGKPDDPRDVLATLSAIAALANCCDLGLASGGAAAAWGATAGWLTMVPDHFSDLVSRDGPPALVVVAHWAAFLVGRIEQSGCWFFRGLSTAILQQILASIPADDVAVRRLVGSFIT